MAGNVWSRSPSEWAAQRNNGEETSAPYLPTVSLLPVLLRLLSSADAAVPCALPSYPSVLRSSSAHTNEILRYLLQGRTFGDHIDPQKATGKPKL
jgi:hypothetical protein